MNEEFLQYLWKFRLLHRELRTVRGELIEVLHPGEQNTDSGPDFFNARLRIAGTVWAGNVEIHIRTSDWYGHGHQYDRAYDNLILHVVYKHDAEMKGDAAQKMPVLEIKGFFSESLFYGYQAMMMNRTWVPCEKEIGDLDENPFPLWAPSLAVERLLEKHEQIARLWESTDKDWEETLFRHLASCFGFRINSLPFEMLAKSIRLKVIRKHVDNLLQLEALLYGQAGMLDREFEDEYPQMLAREYKHLKALYGLSPIPVQIWKYLRLRPSNFPTIRISQFAKLLHRTRGMFFTMVESGDYQQCREFLDLHASSYWETHFLPDRLAPHHAVTMGEASVDLLIINGIAAFIFFSGMRNADAVARVKALSLLEGIRPETNSDIIRWQNAGMAVENALHTQALIHLRKAYCNARRCLSCRLGDKILRGLKEDHKPAVKICTV